MQFRVPRAVFSTFSEGAMYVNESSHGSSNFTVTDLPSFWESMCVLLGAAIAQSVERLATGWTVRGSNSGRGEIFRTRPDRPWGPPSLLYNVYRVFPGGEAVGAWCWPVTPSSAKVKGIVELYLCTFCGPSWPVLGRPLPLPLNSVTQAWQR